MKEYLRSLNILSTDELNQIDSLINTRVLEKGEYLIREGQICREIAFIEEGVLRSFFVNKDGEDITNCISFSNDLMSAYSSYLNQDPTQENIQAIVKTRIQFISRANFDYLLESGINWQKIGRRLAEMQYVSLENRVVSFQKDSASIRYLELLKKQPQYVKLIPLHYISSYLGISTRHLTRIRKSLL